MKGYSIKDLEHLTGIKAHTIRIWEKRYRILSPQRTNTNIRVYSNDQLKKLLNIATLLNYGWKISVVSGMGTSEMQQEVEKWMHNDDKDNQVQINALVYRALAYDQTGFEAIFDHCVNLLGLKRTLIEVVYPFLTRVGILWRVDQMIPAQEHFASNIVKRKLHAGLNNLPKPNHKKDTYLLFLPPKEYHEIGLLLAEYIIRSAGHKVIYLGADVPLQNVIEAGRTNAVDFFCTFFITCRPSMEISEIITSLCSTFRDKQVLISGCSKYFEQIEFPENATTVKSIPVLEAFV